MCFPVYVFLADFYAHAHSFALGATGVVFLLACGFDALIDPMTGVPAIASAWPPAENARHRPSRRSAERTSGGFEAAHERGFADRHDAVAIKFHTLRIMKRRCIFPA